jgi:hypothetical protein
VNIRLIPPDMLSRRDRHCSYQTLLPILNALAGCDSAERSPVVHHLTTLFKRIATTVRRLSLVTQCRGQRRLRQVTRILRRFGTPIPECGPECVFPSKLARHSEFGHSDPKSATPEGSRCATAGQVSGLSSRQRERGTDAGRESVHATRA